MSVLNADVDNPTDHARKTASDEETLWCIEEDGEAQGRDETGNQLDDHDGPPSLEYLNGHGYSGANCESCQ